MLFFVYHADMNKIIGCSGGPDSMALLDILRNQNDKVIVAHVNYQKRETAQRDENIVLEYCQKYGIECRVIRVKYDHSYNFEAWARDVRYAFFEKLCDEFDTKEIYVAHHMDDHIETYLFQIQRDMLCEWYGLKDRLDRHGYYVNRPLLKYTKKDLEEYCHLHHIEYGIDETNLSNDYTRNKIRHDNIEHMSKCEKEEMCKVIEKKNRENLELNKEMDSFLIQFKVDDLLSKKENWRYLERFLYLNIGHHYARKHCKDLCEKLKKDILIELDGYDLERFHDVLYCVKQKDKVWDVYTSVEYGDHKDYTFCTEGKTIEGVTLKADDFPICIRTVREKDEIVLRFGKKNIHRFFVDRKIPKHQRKNWLVMENAQKEIIFVPKIGCDVEHFSVNPNLFMIK